MIPKGVSVAAFLAIGLMVTFDHTVSARRCFVCNSDEDAACLTKPTTLSSKECNPTTSPSSTTTESPTISPSSTTTESPTTSPSSTTTESPTTSPSSTTTESPTTSPSSTTTESPTTSPSSTTTESPTTSPSSTTTESPTTSPSSTTTESPTTSPSSTTTESPTTSPSSTTTESPTTSPSSTTTESPITSPSSTTTKSPEASSSTNETTSPTIATSPTTTTIVAAPNITEKPDFDLFNQIDDIEVRRSRRGAIESREDSEVLQCFKLTYKGDGKEIVERGCLTKENTCEKLKMGKTEPGCYACDDKDECNGSSQLGLGLLNVIIPVAIAALFAR